MNITEQLIYILSLIDFNKGYCQPNAIIGQVCPPGALGSARNSAMLEPEWSTQREAMLLMLDQIDYTRGACSPSEMVAACIPQSVFERCYAAIA